MPPASTTRGQASFRKVLFQTERFELILFNYNKPLQGSYGTSIASSQSELWLVVDIILARSAMDSQL